MSKKNELESLKTKIKIVGDCWMWTGPILKTSNGGYGRVRFGKSKKLVHVIMYEAKHGKVPRGKVLGHSCFTSLCVNPDHVRPITQLKNMRESRPALKAHCVHGHLRTPKNTITYRRKGGSGRAFKVCLVCYAIRYPGTTKRKTK